MVYMVYMVYDGSNTLRRMHADCIRVPLMTSLRDGGGDGGGGADGGGGDRGCEGGGLGGRDSRCSNGDRVGGHRWPLSAIMLLVAGRRGRLEGGELSCGGIEGGEGGDEGVEFRSGKAARAAARAACSATAVPYSLYRKQPNVKGPCFRVRGREKCENGTNGWVHVASTSIEPNRVGLVLRACRRAGSFCVWFDLLANYNVRSTVHSDDTSQACPSIALAADPPARPPQGSQRERRLRRQCDARIRASCTRCRLVRRRRLPG